MHLPVQPSNASVWRLVRTVAPVLWTDSAKTWNNSSAAQSTPHVSRFWCLLNSFHFLCQWVQPLGIYFVAQVGDWRGHEETCGPFQKQSCLFDSIKDFLQCVEYSCSGWSGDQNVVDVDHNIWDPLGEGLHCMLEYTRSRRHTKW